MPSVLVIDLVLGLYSLPTPEKMGIQWRGGDLEGLPKAAEDRQRGRFEEGEAANPGTLRARGGEEVAVGGSRSRGVEHRKEGVYGEGRGGAL